MMFKTNLCQEGLSSSITNMVVDYLNMVKDIIAEEPYRYYDIVIEIEQWLKQCGWTKSGFYTEPNPYKISQGLEQIIYKYF